MYHDLAEAFSKLNIIQFSFIFYSTFYKKIVFRGFIESETQSLNPQVSTLARKNSLLTGRNPEKSMQHQGPGTGDERETQRSGEEGEKDTEQQGRLDTLIFLVRMKSTRKTREGVEMVVDFGELENWSVAHVCVPSSVAL